MKISLFASAAVAAGLLLAGGAHAAELVNGTYYGFGNNYAPGNWTVMTSLNGYEDALRAHVRYPPTAAPAPVGDTYFFALGEPLSVDWSFDNVGQNLTIGVESLIILTNAAGGSVSWDPYNLPGNDDAINPGQTGGKQNSFQLAWFPSLNDNPNIDGTYFVDFRVTGVGFDVSNHITLQRGAGYSATPEPASWALMIMGFGGIGAAMRKRRATVAFA